jgi:hypothetical protein
MAVSAEMPKLLALRHGRQRSIQIVGPSVVWANDPAWAVAGTIEKPRCAMPAHVEKRRHLGVALPNRHHGLA